MRGQHGNEDLSLDNVIYIHNIICITCTHNGGYEMNDLCICSCLSQRENIVPNCYSTNENTRNMGILDGHSALSPGQCNACFDWIEPVRVVGWATISPISLGRMACYNLLSLSNRVYFMFYMGLFKMYSLYICNIFLYNTSYRKQSGSSSPVGAAVQLWLYLGNVTKRLGLGCTLWRLFRLSWGLICRLGYVSFTNCSFTIFTWMQFPSTNRKRAMFFHYIGGVYPWECLAPSGDSLRIILLG